MHVRPNDTYSCVLRVIIRYLGNFLGVIGYVGGMDI